jgi:hypothetical protein
VKGKRENTKGENAKGEKLDPETIGKATKSVLATISTNRDTMRGVEVNLLGYSIMIKKFVGVKPTNTPGPKTASNDDIRF